MPISSFAQIRFALPCDSVGKVVCNDPVAVLQGEFNTGFGLFPRSLVSRSSALHCSRSGWPLRTGQRRHRSPGLHAWSTRSDAAVPGIARAFDEPFQAVSNGETGDELPVLVT